ncbi:hypothetical protein [Brevibacillus sp. HD3.3A]|uniref:hypothetical protein n=1 Tax=Brevibacillus sp. HD3.3A TaxID=2738979 RepID=UPI001E5D5B60|nr:hypothetical protein [Brevibacillus sp. HD3.3A]UED70689.1 hypothetical protein HP435_08660 [Brevibacillus sp. HD3.3A]
MTEKEQKLIARLRNEVGDKDLPYRFLDDDLLDLLNEAIGDYSRHRPRVQRGKITLLPDITEYQLPDDYQTWISGLTGYEIFDRTLFLSVPPVGNFDLTFTYLADHTLESITDRDVSLLFDYSMWKLLDNIVREGAEISGLKLGKGLEIKFDNFDQISKEAERRLKRYTDSISKPIGVWT